MNYTKPLSFTTKVVVQEFYENSDNSSADQKSKEPLSVSCLFPKTNNTATVQISLKSASIAYVLGAAAFFLVFASSAALLADYLTGYNSVVIHKIVKLFYVDIELNVPAFFSMLLLLFASSLLTVIAILKRKQMDSYTWQWAILAGGFLFMAFDEIVSVHERLIEPMRAILGKEHLGVLYFAWVVPAAALVLFIAVCFLKFLWNIPAKTRLHFVIAATLFLGGAIGFEFIEGFHSEIHGKENLTYMILTTVEETLEML